jgi:hypothetical protein
MRATRLLLATSLTGAVVLAATPALAKGQITQLGKYLEEYNGNQLKVVLNYRQSAQNPSSPWLFFKVGVMGSSGKEVAVKRAKVFLLDPRGRRTPLLDQGDFARNFAAIRQAENAGGFGDPIGAYFNTAWWIRPLDFFSVPGRHAHLVFPAVHVNDHWAYLGRLVFAAPMGERTGEWTLGIDLPSHVVRIPFQL